jgi:hypothetical protein
LANHILKRSGGELGAFLVGQVDISGLNSRIQGPRRNERRRNGPVRQKVSNFVERGIGLNIRGIQGLGRRRGYILIAWGHRISTGIQNLIELIDGLKGHLDFALLVLKG